MENILKNNEHGIKVLVVICAAVFALIQYFDRLEEARVARTLEFYKQFSSEPIYSSRLKVAAFWEELWSELEHIEKPKDETEKEGARHRSEFQRIVEENIEQDMKLVANIDSVFEFFNALQVCIEGNICDEKSARSLLKYQAEQFVKSNCAYIGFIWYNRGNKSFAEKAILFAGSHQCDASIYKK